MAGNNKIEKTSKTRNTAPITSMIPPPSPSSPPLSALKAQTRRETSVKRAAAIQYEPGEDDAPVLAAFGEGYVAEKIIEVARESGVPVLPDPSLASMLSKISVGDEIPEELYEAVARVLVFVSEIDRSYGEKVRKNV